MKIKFKKEDVSIDYNSSYVGDIDTNISIKINDITDKQIKNIKIIGYSTTFKQSKGNDIEKINKNNIKVFITHNNKDNDTTYFLDIDANKDLIFITKENINFFELDNKEQHINNIVENYIKMGDNINARFNN
ncbi:MAG: hypothetical protein M0R51_09465 [Clostridia bacterium]|jgi:hypothetical protein|nr:hypothetical protein [Clostridia bacterium]